MCGECIAIASVWQSYCPLLPVLCYVVSLMVAFRFNKPMVVMIVSSQVDLLLRRSRFHPSEPSPTAIRAAEGNDAAV